LRAKTGPGNGWQRPKRAGSSVQGGLRFPRMASGRLAFDMGWGELKEAARLDIDLAAYCS